MKTHLTTCRVQTKIVRKKTKKKRDIPRKNTSPNAKLVLTRQLPRPPGQP